MTKKAEKILNELNENFETNVFLYREDIIDYEQCYCELQVEKDRCMAMVSHMFHYHLLCEKDFGGLYQHIIILCDEYRDRVNKMLIEKRGF